MQTSSNRKLRFENLEERRLLSAAPLGAAANDTAEFMLGRVLVTPVFLESDGTLDTSTEDWSVSEDPLESEVDLMLQKVHDSVQWWADTLDGLDSVHELEFVIDETYARNPHPTRYEPISRPSTDYTLWVGEFLQDVGQTEGFGLEQAIRNFNHQQREKYDTDWAFTMFIVDSSSDNDGKFAPGGPFSFRTAFAFPGGLFLISPSTRPTSTLTHETGHIFYAVDEYQQGALFDARRGYYNTQNVNGFGNNRPGGVENPDPNFVQEPTIMSGGITLQTAYLQKTSAATTLAFVGWQDSDGDGIFDVLDVPLELSGTGRIDGETNTYRFNGTASAKTLPNQNSAGLQNDITLNEISQIEYRLDGGEWQIAAEPGTQVANLDLSIPLGTSSFGLIEIRAKDRHSGVLSNVYQATADAPASTDLTGIQGFVWLDQNEDSRFDNFEAALGNAKVHLVDDLGEPISLHQAIEPDNFSDGPIDVPNVTLTAIGESFTGTEFTIGNVSGLMSDNASTGSKAFFVFDRNKLTFSETWNSSGALTQKFRAAFENPTNQVSIDITGLVPQSSGRLEAYDAGGNLLTRTTSQAIGPGESTTLTVTTDQPEIAYILAFGHANTSVSLDNLVRGPGNSATSDTNGVFSLPGLPDGQYFLSVETEKPLIHQVSSDLIPVEVIDGVALQVSIAAIQQVSPWQNPLEPADVDDSGDVAPLDALRILNELGRSGSRALTDDNFSAPYFDVNGDSTISPVDALNVLNELNRPAAESESLGAAKQSSAQRESLVDSVFSGKEGVESVLAGSGEAEFLSIPTIASANDAERDDDDGAYHDLCYPQNLQ